MSSQTRGPLTRGGVGSRWAAAGPPAIARVPAAAAATKLRRVRLSPLGSSWDMTPPAAKEPIDHSSVFGVVFSVLGSGRRIGPEVSVHASKRCIAGHFGRDVFDDPEQSRQNHLGLD